MSDQGRGPGDDKPPEDERFQVFMLKRALAVLVALAIGLVLFVVYRLWK